ncbi:Uncharacterized protein TCM_006583 [Theobroma cacao]|uniref:Uncharacterized protein n=1 Tax=Theobroma cacao TaxID=3641 RepID=A0A061DXW1_THECC|nr:Uncharacterized protein TCM_006583 [Theobroma cacao]
MVEFFFFFFISSTKREVFLCERFWLWPPTTYINSLSLSFLSCFSISLLFLPLILSRQDHKRPTMESLKPAKQWSSFGLHTTMIIEREEIKKREREREKIHSLERVNEIKFCGLWYSTSPHKMKGITRGSTGCLPRTLLLPVLRCIHLHPLSCYTC